MTSVKVKFRPSSLPDREGSVFYQIIRQRKPRQLLTPYRIFPAEWDEKRGAVLTPVNPDRHSILLSIRERIRWDLERLSKTIRKLDASGLAFSSDEIIAEFHRQAREYSLFNFMECIIVALKEKGKMRTSETYTAALRNFQKFRQGEDLMLDSIAPQLMENYEAWQQQRGVTPNTISFYMRILRAVYNRAVDCDIIENRNPFRRVYTGVDKTVKRALPLTTVRQIRALDLGCHPSLDYARDIFILSFMLRGMSFIDMAFLRKTDLRNGQVTYRRRKTGQRLTIKWTAEMQQILDKYPANTSPYLLPIIRKPTANERSVYHNVGYRINRNLKKIAEMVGIPVPLTLYVARHSWASAAKAKGIPVSVISEGMGHDSEATTQIYLASLDTSVVDNANSLILASL